MNNLALAIQFAKEKHKGQKYGEYDYSHHLDQVLELAKQFTEDEEILIACYLHDIIEDTSVNYGELRYIFGKRVAEIVYAVTDELGRNRKERKQKTYHKIKENSEAVFVKLCDRICNIKASVNNQNKLLMYAKEHQEFVNNLYTNGVLSGLWKEYLTLFNNE